MINRDLKIRGSPKLLFQISDNLVNSIGEIDTVVRNSDNQESDGKYGLALREWNFALVQATGSFNLAQAGNKTVQGLGGTSNDKCLGSIVKRDGNLGVLRLVLVCLGDLRLEVLQRKASD